MDVGMLETTTKRSKAPYLPAILLGSTAGWYIGRMFGLNAGQWFVEPEFNFELLTGISGFTCGAFFAFTSNKPFLLRILGMNITSGFFSTIIAYWYYSFDIPPHKFDLPELLIQTFGGWFPLLLGATSVMLVRVITR
jgi:hypothetical protein